MVTPSGLLPSDLSRTEGSNLLGIFTAAKERLIMSFSALGLEDLPWLALQHRPWRLNWSTSLFTAMTTSVGLANRSTYPKPYGYPYCAIGHAQPKRRMGGALSQAPDSLEPAASNWALETGSSQWDRRESDRWSTLGLSHDLWWLGEVGRGISTCRSLFQADKAESLSQYATHESWAGRSSCISLEAPSADARKVDGAR